MYLVVVEDEARVAEFLKASLEAESHSVRICSGVEELEALLLVSGEGPHGFILDRMLGSSDGVAYIPLIKRRFPESQVLVLSAIDLAEEKARALDLGADDYLAKPFSVAELTARLRVLSRRRGSKAAPSLFTVKDLALDLRSQGGFVKGERLDLTRKEFQVLLVLCESPGRVFNKFQLLERVWDVQADVESNTVEVTIRKIRCKLEVAHSELQVLSRRNVGYWVEP